MTPEQKDALIALLVEDIRLWRSLASETGGVPRYTVVPGAALNTVVESTDALLRRLMLLGL